MLTNHYIHSASECEVWSEQAEPLAEWTQKRLVNRTDRHGGYRSDAQIARVGAVNKSWTPKNLTRDKLLRHFRATDRIHLIGLHAADENNQTLWGALDIDAHGGADATANERAALHWFDSVVKMGFHPLLTDSDGSGGFHLRILFNEKVAADRVYRYLKDLTADHDQLGLATPPETFPKQEDVRKCSGGLGNWLRVPGKHHNHDHWSKVYHEGEWLDGLDAVEHVLSLPGDPSSLLIPRGLSSGGAAGEASKRMTGTDGADCIDGITLKLSHKRELKKALGEDIFTQVVDIVRHHGPQKPRQREKRGFKVVQKLLGIRSAWSLPERIHFAHLWYELVKDIVGTKDKQEIVQHIVRCFDDVKHPGGFDLEQVIRASAQEPVPDTLKLLGDKDLERLAQVCSYLQRQNPQKPFFINNEQAGEVLGATSMTGWRKLDFLEKTMKLLKRVEVGTWATGGKPGRSSTYWYLPLAVVDGSKVA